MHQSEANKSKPPTRSIGHIALAYRIHNKHPGGWIGLTGQLQHKPSTLKLYYSPIG